MSQPPHDERDRRSDGRDHPAQPSGHGQQPYAQQPYPQQPYPQQPWAQGYPQQPAPPYGGPPPGRPAPQPRPRRTALLVLVGAGALALVLAVVAVAVNVRGDDAATGGSGTGTSTGGATAPAGPAASDAVAGFLQALAEQDATAALSYAADPGAFDTTLMTPEVLAASAELAPLGDIDVPPVTDQGATSVPARYTLGKTPVSTSFGVVKVGDAWKLTTVGASIDVSDASTSVMPMLVNGAKVDTDSLTVLPGAYRFSTGKKYYDYGKDDEVLVGSPSDDQVAANLVPEVSRTGRSAALSAVRKAWSTCLGSHVAEPKGCPNSWHRDDTSWRKGTVRWSRNGSDPLEDPKATVYSNAVFYPVHVDLRLRGTCTVKGRTGTCTGTLGGKSQSTAYAQAHFTGTKIEVSWS